MSRRAKQLWIQDADQLLEDGEWHDGSEWRHAIEKRITPGVAVRHLENVRARQAARRLGVTRDQAPARSKPLSMEAQVAAGKRDLIRVFLNDRVRLKIYEVTPWPLPPEQWSQGGWALRLIQRYTPGSLEKRYGIAAEKIRELILDEPPLRHRALGGHRIQILAAELPELDRRVEIYKAGSRQRRQQAAQQRWTDWHAGEPQFISATDLGRRSQMSTTTVARLLVEHSQLGAVQSGRVWRLPLTRLEAWDAVVLAYKSTAVGRKAEQLRAASQAAALKRTGRSESGT